ncbi:MAG: hypothetical protein HHJ17_15630 [Rhodoferax sp.]|uniref:hypothetical protein n=1 Tax=Rhodoferax sp. TaxID=50421 RepID=UPI0017D40813|nr:hypothetical protein [Rhodoferax sp.]NMM14951.1 hypothetical protein [Rhodoferax sp.]
MKLQIANDAIRGADKAGHVMLVAAILAACALAGGSTLLSIAPVTTPSSTRAESAFPVGPADREVAERYGTIDHSSLNDPRIVPEQNPAAAAIAAYETPPQ